PSWLSRQHDLGGEPGKENCNVWTNDGCTRRAGRLRRRSADSGSRTNKGCRKRRDRSLDRVAGVGPAVLARARRSGFWGTILFSRFLTSTTKAGNFGRRSHEGQNFASFLIRIIIVLYS